MRPRSLVGGIRTRDQRQSKDPRRSLRGKTVRWLESAMVPDWRDAPRYDEQFVDRAPAARVAVDVASHLDDVALEAVIKVVHRGGVGIGFEDHDAVP